MASRCRSRNCSLAASLMGSRPVGRDGEAGDASSHLRLAFCKSRATIEQALERLESWAAPRR